MDCCPEVVKSESSITGAKRAHGWDRKVNILESSSLKGHKTKNRKGVQRE